MKIGIIGAGNIGQVLALRWVEHGHEVLYRQLARAGYAGRCRQRNRREAGRTRGGGARRGGDRGDDSAKRKC